jgi:hypothetical protein
MLEDYEDYIEAILEENTLMAASGKKKIVRFVTDLPAPDRVSSLAPTYVVHSEFSGFTVGESLQQWTSMLQVMQQVPATGNLETNVRNARRRTLNIAEQLVSRLVHDADTGASCELINGLDENVQIDYLGIEDENAYGWRISLRFTTVRHEYDPSEWTA